MQVQDVMTTTVVTVSPDTTIDDIVRILLDKGISAVPVVDEAGRVQGVVSEADLLHRPEIDTWKPRRWWLEMWKGDSELARNYTRTHGMRARDVMSTHLLQVTPETPLHDALLRMEGHGMRRVLVIDGKKLVGVVTRSNVVRGLLASREKAADAAADRGIRARLLN